VAQTDAKPLPDVGDRQEHVEYAQAKRARAVIDIEAREATLAHRRRNRPPLSAALDPGPVVLRERARAAGAFIADDGHPTASVRQARLHSNPVGLVRAVSVTAAGDFTPGTLVVRVAAADLASVDPRTLQLIRLDEQAETCSVVEMAGFNVEQGYMWGRITTPGRYGVFGLPDPGVLERLETYEAFDMRPLQAAIVFLFKPEGLWRSLGPVNLSCCVMDLAIDPSDNQSLFAATSDGGVWHLPSIAAYPQLFWRPLTDYQDSLVIRCLAVSPANAQVVYYVDDAGRVMRSQDGGGSWGEYGTTRVGYAWRLLAHPTDPLTIFVATDSGVWCSKTGGYTWESNPGQTTLRDGDFTDLAMDPSNASILYAAQRNVGVLKSYDAGATWSTVLPWSSATSPAGTMIKVAVGGQGTDANRTVAVRLDQEVFVNRAGGRPPSVSGGSPWTSVGMGGGNGYQDWCHVIAVDPFDDNTILAGGQQLMRTIDGGATWSVAIDYYEPHEDQHRVVFDPTQRGVVYAANDGGVFRSTDSGATWQSGDDDVAAKHDLTRGLVNAQFYTAGISGDHAVGDAYHQGLLGAESLGIGVWQGIEGHSWEFNNVFGDPVRRNRYYVFGTKLSRRTYPPASGPFVDIGSFSPTAIAVDPRPGSEMLFVGTIAGQLMVTTDGAGDSPTWTVAPGIALAGGDMIVSIDFTRAAGQHAYALARSGRVFVCANLDAPSWTEVAALPQAGVALAASFEQESLVFAIGSSSVFRTADGGATPWTAVPGRGLYTIPPGQAFRSIACGPNALYVATAWAISRSADAGQTWGYYTVGLPNVQIQELLWTGQDLFAVTHGRGIWHHGEVSAVGAPPATHAPDAAWLIRLWLAIHGGDPPPFAVRERVGRSLHQASAARDVRRGGG
jgi:hypothetical protein